MKLCWTTLLLVLLTGCETTHGTSPAPSPGAKPAKKTELPPLPVTGGRMRTTLFYGPWQCTPSWMSSCQRACASEARQLMGCMWLADIKLDWEGHLFLPPPLPVEAGGRYAIYHCCCNYPTLTPTQKKPLRDQWNKVRDSFREEWSKKFGQWPFEKGEHWPGHHIRDLQHGGNPIDPSNILPAPPDIHNEFGKQYPACYEGKAPWNKVGPDLPYTDN